MRCFQSILILVFAAVLTAPAANAQNRSQTQYDRPEFARATEALTRQLVRRYGRASKKNAAVFFIQAEQLTRQKNRRAALPLYGRTIAAGLNNYRQWQRYAWALASAGRFQQSLAASYGAYLAARRTRKPADMAYALYLVGFSLEALRRYDHAINTFEASLKFRRRGDASRRLTRLIMRHRQQVMSTRVEKETDTPRICLTFSRQLPSANPALFDQYVKLSPAVKAAFAVRGRVLCIEGVRHGATYGVTVREGLPEARGALRTTKQVAYRISVPNRAMRIGFRGKTFILPRVGRRGIPMLSVNVARAQIRLLRINDRNLVRQINDRAMYRMLTARRGSKIANTEGEEVWRGTVEISKKMNRQVATAIPVARILKTTAPGIYILMARPWRKDGKYDRWEDQATQYLVVSDLGVSTYRGKQLAIFVRSFASGETKAGVRVSLIARNNKILGTATSDASGRVTFAAGLIRGSGGNRPAAVMVRTSDSDFNFQSLSGPAFDLSDRGVSGRAAPGPVDGYVYTERGVYRPGETVHVVALLRDEKADAIHGMPVTFKLFRPDGVQARKFVVKDSGAGGYRLSIPMSRAARTGGWTPRAYVDPKGRAIGRVRFQVEDFVPEKLEMKLKAAAEALRPGQANSILVNGRFLYGAPAADLTVEATLRLQMDFRPYPKWKGYTFGLVTDTWQSKRITLKPTRTDAKGRAVLAIAIDGAPQTTRPLKAVIRVSLLEAGGRALERTVSVPVRAKPLVLGIKLANGDGSVPAGQAAKLSVIALDRNGQRQGAAGLSYRLVREVYRYYWYFTNGYWRYRIIRRDEPVKKGTLEVTADAAGALAFASQDGRYRIEVRDRTTGAAASIRYHVGWWTPPGRDNVPDKLTVRLDKKSYKAGDTAKVFLRPPFDGVVHLVVATNKILMSRTVKVGRSGTTVELKVDGSWGPGAYVMATAYRPTNAPQKVGPSRAIGLTYLARDFSKRTLSVTVEGPEMIRPRGKVELTVRVGNVPAGEKVMVTVAAVDEGILSLTGYKSPAPQGHFYAKRRLAMDVRDDYGRLIDAFAGAFGKIRQGGDAGAKSMGSLDASSIKTVSLFTGIVTVGADGAARVTLDVPDFNGRLRVMAVAWSKSGVGSTERPLTVRDPVVSLVTLPRFLAPGDRGAVTVSLNNVDGQAGRYAAIRST